MLLVRRLRITDLPQLEILEREHAKGLRDPAAWVERSHRLVEKTLTEEPEALMIAEQDGQVVGWAIAKPSDLHPMQGARLGEVIHLAVHPRARRKGVAQRLLLEAEAYLRSRGCDTLHLSLPMDVLPLTEFLKRRGYQVTAWEMQRKLR